MTTQPTAAGNAAATPICGPGTPLHTYPGGNPDAAGPAGSASFTGCQVTQEQPYHIAPRAVTRVWPDGGSETLFFCGACAARQHIGDVRGGGEAVAICGFTRRDLDVGPRDEYGCEDCGHVIAPAICAECFELDDDCECDEYEAPTANSYFEGRRID